MSTSTASPDLMQLTVKDVAGQRPFHVRNLSKDTTVAQLLKGLVERMGLSRKDPAGREHSYEAFLAREGRHLHPSDRVGDTLQDKDTIVLQADIQAGGWC